MNLNRGLKSFQLNEELVNKIKEWFEANPCSHFNLKTLNECFQDDVHPYLVKLETYSNLIRSKIDINGKPVTHWKLKNIKEGVVKKTLTPNGHLQTNSEKSNYNPQSQRNENDNLKSNTTNNETRIPKVVRDEAVHNGKCNPPPRRLIGKLQSSESQIVKVNETRQLLSTLTVDEPDAAKPRSVPEVTSTIKSTQINEIPKKEVKLIACNHCNDFKEALEKNPVSVLYEYAQSKGINCQIELTEMTGPSHQPKISMLVSLAGRKFNSVVALNKKEAKKLAADLAIKTLISEGLFSKSIYNSVVQASMKKEANKTERINPSKNSTLMVDRIASMVCNELTVLLRELSFERRNSLAGRIIISGIVMQDEKQDTFRVVALATGNRCISGDNISLQGKVVNDCHAEIVARRSFLLFLYQQLSAHLTLSEDSLDIWEDFQESTSLSVLNRFKIKSHMKFHLYISTAPCGDGALFCSKENNPPKLESELIDCHEHYPTFEHPVQGLLRSKIEGGEGTIPVENLNKPSQVQNLDGILRGERLRTMSCSDKIARWNYLGLQGSLLTQFIEPVYLTSISLGNMYDSGHLARALCCRIDENRCNRFTVCNEVNHPKLGFVHTGSLQKESDKQSQFSVNWSYGLKLEIIDGVSGTLTGQDKQLVCSRIAKASLFHHYLKLFRLAGYNPFINRYSYSEAKLLSGDYETRKKRLFEIFYKLEYGSWLRKPMEQNDFKDNLYN